MIGCSLPNTNLLIFSFIIRPMYKLSLFFLGLFSSLIAPAQLVSDSIEINGHFRTFHFNKPKSDLAGGSLVFILHGSGGSGLQAIQRTAKLEALSANEKFLAVYPDGYKRYWNECRKSSNAEANTIDINEEEFFKAMIAYFRKNFAIEQSKVFVAGFSGGGHMAYKLALTIPDQIRAITAIVANLPEPASSDCHPVNKPIPVLIINGTDDQTNPYKGGEMFVNNASFGKVMSSEENFHYWAKLAGYSGDAKMEKLPDTDPNDQKTIESYSYKDKNKPEIRLLKVVGGKHDYPNDIDVYVYAWEFFKRQGDNFKF